MIGCERDAGAIAAAKANAVRAGVTEQVEFFQRSLGDSQVPELHGDGGVKVGVWVGALG